jgi:hypothetical protein
MTLSVMNAANTFSLEVDESRGVGQGAYTSASNISISLKPPLPDTTKAHDIAGSRVVPTGISDRLIRRKSGMELSYHISASCGRSS